MFFCAFENSFWNLMGNNFHSTMSYFDSHVAYVNFFVLSLLTIMRYNSLITFLCLSTFHVLSTDFRCQHHSLWAEEAATAHHKGSQTCVDLCRRNHFSRFWQNPEEISLFPSDQLLWNCLRCSCFCENFCSLIISLHCQSLYDTVANKCCVATNRVYLYRLGSSPTSPERIHCEAQQVAFCLYTAV